MKSMTGATRFVLGVLSGAAGYGVINDIYNDRKPLHVEYQEGVDGK